MSKEVEYKEVTYKVRNSNQMDSDEKRIIFRIFSRKKQLKKFGDT